MECMRHEWIGDDGHTWAADSELACLVDGEPADAQSCDEWPDEMLRLAARVRELEELTGGEASNRYVVDSLRKIREALRAAGLWRARADGQGGTGDCAVEAVARIAALEADLATSREFHRRAVERNQDSRLRFQGRIATLEAAEHDIQQFNAALRNRLDRADARIVALEGENAELKARLDRSEHAFTYMQRRLDDEDEPEQEFPVPGCNCTNCREAREPHP